MRRSKAVVWAIGTAVMSLLEVASLRAGQSPADASPLSEQYFKNVQVLKGMPVDTFLDAMGMFAASMGNVNANDGWQVHFRDTMRGGKFLNHYRMAELHVQYMDEPGPTDVLSFPMDDLRIPSEGEPAPVVAAVAAVVSARMSAVVIAEMSLVSIFTPAGDVKVRITGRNACVASKGASSVRV